MKKQIINIGLAFSTMLMLSACGGSSNDTTPAATPTTDILTGTFIDAPVKGLAYKTATQSGFTDSNGTYKYKSGETIEFKLGTLSFGSATADKTMTPYTMSGSTIDTPNDKARNIAMLLQNFDDDRTDSTLDISALASYDFSDFNLSATTSATESKLTTLLATGAFQLLIDGNNYSLINSAAAILAMNKYISGETIQDTKKFTQAYLDTVDFYQADTTDEGGNQRVRFRDGEKQIVGDYSTSVDGGFYATFDNPADFYTRSYTLEDGIIVEEVPVGNDVLKISSKLTNISETSLTILGTVLESTLTKLPVGMTKIEILYTSKSEAIKNSISVRDGFGSLWIKNNTMYIPINDNGSKSVAAIIFKNSNRVLPDGSTAPYVINKDGWTVVSERIDYDQVTKIVAIDSTRIDVITGSINEVSSATADTQVRFTSLSDAQAYLSNI